MGAYGLGVTPVALAHSHSNSESAMFTLLIVRGIGSSSRVFETWRDATLWAFHQYAVNCDVLIGCEAKNLMVHRSPGGKIEWSPI